MSLENNFKVRDFVDFFNYLFLEKKTIVFGLDGTLVHVSQKPTAGYDIIKEVCFKEVNFDTGKESVEKRKVYITYRGGILTNTRKKKHVVT